MRYTVFADKEGPQPNRFPEEGDWECVEDLVSLKIARIAAAAIVAAGYARADVVEGKNGGHVVEHWTAKGREKAEDDGHDAPCLCGAAMLAPGHCEVEDCVVNVTS